MNEQVLSIIRRDKFVEYLEKIGVDTDNFFEKVESVFNNDVFNLFINNYEGLLSPNICIEETLFRVFYRYLNDDSLDKLFLEFDKRLDVRAIIAHSKSLIQRPDISIPVETLIGFKEPGFEGDFVRIARFEKQLNLRGDGGGRCANISLLFEGLLIDEIDMDPLINILSSNHIWSGSFYSGLPVIQGMCGVINSLEPANILWINSDLVEHLGLKVDNYKYGLRAINENDEVVLEFRHWKENLISNGSSFVAINSNIASFEGSDLMLRADYYKKLESLIPNLTFKSYVVS